MYLVNVNDPEKGMVGVRQVVRTIDPALIFGDDLPEVGQIHAFFVRLAMEFQIMQSNSIRFLLDWDSKCHNVIRSPNGKHDRFRIP